MTTLKYFTLALCLTICTTAFSQKGKNGALTVTAANTRINEFTALTANANVGNTTITVAVSSLNANGRFSAGLAAGDLVMIIQMQGALIKVKPYNPWEPFVTDSLYGLIYSYQNCGNYEFAQVKTVISATQIELECGLTFNYSSAGKTQVVRVPRYSSLTVNGSGTLTTDAWNGTTGIGGVLVAEVSGNTIIDGVVTATGLGFRGGLPTASGGTNFGPLSTNTSNNNGSEKGEGIGSDRLDNSIDSLGRYCKGAPGNAGGGGNANNCGGGGGGNGGVISNYNGHGNPSAGYNAIWNLEWPGKASVTSSGGGKGGYGTSTTTTANINSVGPNSTSWGTFRRISGGGFGGRPLDYSTGKLFMGGGGGAGHSTGGQSNGAGACAGGAGGGLIFLLNYGTISGSGTIISNGANGRDAYGTVSIGSRIQGIDGAGGAGAGGTIILKSNGAISGITTTANGGNGGSQVISLYVNSSLGINTTTDEGQGPGGGGSGGYIAATNVGFTQNVNGGANGTTNATAFDTEFPMNGATSGDVGTNNQSIAPSFSLTTSANPTICTNQSATLTATSNNATATVLWYNAAAGGNSVASGTVYTTPTYTATGTYTVYAGSCPGIYRVPIIITVGSGVTITVNSPTICPGQTVTLTANGATTYTWNTGPTTNTISVSPSSTTIYTVNATSGTCVGTQTTQVLVSPTPTVSVGNATICSGNSATLTATGATNYTWMPSAQTTSSIVVTPTTNTTYTITGANGTCTNSTTTTVSVTSTPTLSTSSRTICAGQVATFTVSGATTYTWNPGSATGSTYTTSPASSGTVSVIGANGTCTSQVTTSITVTPNPTVAVSNQTICSGQTAILTATGATAYSWSTGATTNTISVSPTSLTIYTVVGTTNSCTNTRTVSVTVNSQPTVAVANANICSGNSTILTATGATNYTWMPGGQLTNTVSVNPGSTTIYTITGATGTCTTSTNATVNVTSTPTLVANSVTICPSQTATLSATGATTYTWNPGNISGTTYTIAPASNTTVSVIGANGTCTTAATVSVTIGTGISITVNNPTICAGETATLTANGATSYTWNPGNLSGSSVTVAPSSNTTYTVTGVNGACTGSNTAIVTIVSTPTLATNSTTICAGQTTTLTASGATTYTWNPGNLSGASVTVTPSSNTTYTVVGANGTCTNSATSSVAIINCNNPCQFSLGRDTAFCSPMNYTINGPVGYNSYSWTPGGATTQNITATNTGTYICTADILSNDLVANGDFSLGNTLFTSNYIVPTVPGAFGLLTNPGTYLITTSPNLAHNNFIPFGDHTTGTGNMMVCNGSAVANDIVWSQTISVSPNTNYNFSAWVASVYNTTAGNEAQLQFSINGSLLGSTYSAPFTAGVWANFATNWNSGVSTSAVITIVDQNFTAPGANDFALDDIFYQQVCSHSDTIIVTENVTPTVTASATNSVICNGNPTTLTASGATTYTWTSGITNGVSFTPTVTTTYSVIGTSVEGCTNTAIQTVTVNSTPTIAVNSASICSGQTATLIATGANTYTWSNSVSGSTQTVSPSATTIYTVTGTDVNGCVSTSAASATVGVSATPTITINSASICAGQTVTLTATGATNVTWNTTETTASIFTSPAITTTYSVVGNNGGCSSTQSTTVSVTPSPTITASVASLSGCAPFCTTFNDVVSSSATGITYNFGDGSSANINNPNHCYLTGGSYTVTATATNSVLGCSSTFTLPVITVDAQVIADFNITPGNTITVGTLANFNNTSTNASTYLWSLSCDGTSLTTQNFSATFVDTGSCCIYLIAESNLGCSDTVRKCIEIVKEAVVVIPNVFTPNGDTKNDVFKINSTGLKSLHCVIFNRWGLKMYEWDGLNGFWDGSAQSGKAPDGTYFYIVDYIDLLDNKTTEKGYLNLFND
jgi:gliding motility-associated-like protein